VARLIAQGLTNKEIGRALVITEKTVGTHVEDIFNRLGFQSRAQVAAWVGTQQGPAFRAAYEASAA
jgi:DNA-binding NarL/FixJ family response regulator